MADYQMVVTRSEPNPDYDAQLEEWKRRDNYYATAMSVAGPSRTFERQVLSVTLTEDEFVAVKRAAIEVTR